MMIRWKDYKLIYYPYGNKFQLFNLEKDAAETHDCIGEPIYKEVVTTMKQYLKENLYGGDLNWLQDDQFCGIPIGKMNQKIDFGLYNQRGYHWPTPHGYCNLGKNA